MGYHERHAREPDLELVAPPVGGARIRALQQIPKATARYPGGRLCHAARAGSDTREAEMDPNETTYQTPGGVTVRRTAEQFDPAVLADLTRQVEAVPGGVLSSGMEYPGRYSRWHVAYVGT
jgi:hypothetical protein